MGTHTIGINQTKFRELNVSEVECRNLVEKLHIGNHCSARKADLVSLPICSTCLIKFSSDEKPFLCLAICISFASLAKIGVYEAIKKSIARVSVRFQPKLASLNDFNKLDDVEVRKNWSDYRLARSCVQTNRAANSE